MKGIVFTEFLDMVEDKFGYNVVDEILNETDLPSGGTYTAVGTYSHSEIVGLLMNLSEKVSIGPEFLLKEFGKHLFDTFLSSYPQFFEAHNEPLSFLESIDNHIHVEVRKLYPDADLPKFTTENDEDGNFNMIYNSERKMGGLAEGLIEKSLAHYNSDYKLSKENITDDGSQVKFIIAK